MARLAALRPPRAQLVHAPGNALTTAEFYSSACSTRTCFATPFASVRLAVLSLSGTPNFGLVRHGLKPAAKIPQLGMGKFARWLLLWCVVAALGASAHAHSALPARYSDQLRKSPLLSHKRAQWTHSTKIDVLARIRGGAEPKKKVTRCYSSGRHAVERVLCVCDRMQQAQQQSSILKSVTNTLGRVRCVHLPVR